MAIIIKTTTTATEKKKEEKKFRINYRMNQNKGMIMNAFPGSQLSVSFPSLGVTVHLTSLGCPLTLC